MCHKKRIPLKRNHRRGLRSIDRHRMMRETLVVILCAINCEIMELTGKSGSIYLVKTKNEKKIIEIVRRLC